MDWPDHVTKMYINLLMYIWLLEFMKYLSENLGNKIENNKERLLTSFCDVFEKRIFKENNTGDIL